MIASATDTIRAYFDESSICFCKPGDPEDLARNIVDLYRNPARREALTAGAHAFNVEHSWAREREKYYALIDSLVTSKPSGSRMPVMPTEREGML